jgi:acyl dehydratase
VPLNLDIIGVPSQPTERSWTSADCLLYALGVGAGAHDPIGSELEFTTENSEGVDQRVLPTFAALLGSGGPGLAAIGDFDRAMMLHGEQSIQLFGPIPPAGAVRTTAVVSGIYDKGSAALVVIDSTSVDAATEEPRFALSRSLFIRGEGGFGGDRGPSSAGPALGDRVPDEVVTYPTRTDQALLYRLSGDRNPLHSDPAFARRAGFDRPILHGLCTYGFTGRALLHTFCGSEPGRFGSMQARFSRPTYPGDVLTVSMWVDGSLVAFRTQNQRGEVVIDGGTFQFMNG